MNAGIKALVNTETLAAPADQMWGLTLGATQAEIDAGLAEVRGSQLRVAVGEVQQMDIAEARNIVCLLGSRGLRERSSSVERKPAGRRSGENLKEVAAVHDSDPE